MWESKIPDLERAQLMMATRAIVFPPTEEENTDSAPAATVAVSRLERRNSVKDSKKATKRASKMAIPTGFEGQVIERFRSWYKGGGFLITQAITEEFRILSAISHAENDLFAAKGWDGLPPRPRLSEYDVDKLREEVISATDAPMPEGVGRSGWQSRLTTAPGSGEGSIRSSRGPSRQASVSLKHDPATTAILQSSIEAALIDSQKVPPTQPAASIKASVKTAAVVAARWPPLDWVTQTRPFKPLTPLTLTQ